MAPVHEHPQIDGHILSGRCLTAISHTVLGPQRRYEPVLPMLRPVVIKASVTYGRPLSCLESNDWVGIAHAQGIEYSPLYSVLI